MTARSSSRMRWMRLRSHLPVPADARMDVVRKELQLSRDSWLSIAGTCAWLQSTGDFLKGPSERCYAAVADSTANLLMAN